MCGDDGRYRPTNPIRSVQADYHFAYSVNNRATGDVKRHSETRNGNQVRGSYYVLEPDGGHRLVEYTADERGFRPHVQRRYERQVPAPYKNYHVNPYNAQRFHPTVRQGLHTSVLPHQNTNPVRLSAEQQREFDNFLLRSQLVINSAGNLNSKSNQEGRGLNWTVDDRYSRPTFGTTTLRSFHQRPQQMFLQPYVYSVKRVDFPLLRNHVGNPHKQRTEAIYNLDIRRSV